jgi:hypothetical protein
MAKNLTPSTPPKGTSPSKNIQRGNDIAFQNGALTGGKTSAQDALAADKSSIRKAIPVGGGKE